MTRFDSESLNAAHTQRHLDEIPQRGPSKPLFPIQAYAYTKADLNAETRELRAEIARLTAEVDQLKNWIDHHSTELPRMTMQRDAAHNAAILAAAELARKLSCKSASSAIRALARPTGEPK